jgi:hypothetical protein
MDKTELKTISNAARLLGCSRQNIYEQIQKGNMQSISIDGHAYVSIGELLRYIEDISPTPLGWTPLGKMLEEEQGE